MSFMIRGEIYHLLNLFLYSSQFRLEQLILNLEISKEKNEMRWVLMIRGNMSFIKLVSTFNIVSFGAINFVPRNKEGKEWDEMGFMIRGEIGHLSNQFRHSSQFRLVQLILYLEIRKEKHEMRWVS